MRIPKQVEVNGKQYTLLPIPARIAMPLEAKALKLMAPVIGMFQNLAGILSILPKKEGSDSVDWNQLGSLDMAKILAMLDMRDISRGLGDALDALAPHEMEYLTLGCLAYVQTYVEGKGNCTLSSFQLVDLAFDDVSTMYKVLFEVARFNKFRPFVLLDSGPATPETAG